MKKYLIVVFLISSTLISFGQGQLFYACTGNFELLKFDISTCDTTFIGYTAAPLGDIALTPDNKLYAINSYMLIEVDTSNAALTTIALMSSFQGGNSLVSDSYGNLLTVSQDSVYQIDRFTGQVFSLGYYGSHSSAGDLTFFDDTLYLSADSGKLVKIILQPVVSSHVVGYMNAANIYGINTVCLNGAETMIASGGDNNYGSLYIVNTANATLSLLCDSIVNSPIYGATSQHDFKSSEDCFFLNSIKYPSLSDEIKIFPNPATEILNVSYNSAEILTISIYDITSKQLIRKVFTNSVALNIENLSAGVYIFEIENAARIIKRGKFLKNDTSQLN